MSKKVNDSWVRIIDVSDTILHKKGYTLYKVTSKVFPKNSVEAVTEVTVWKRYNDFKKLHKALSSLHQGLYLKDQFPPFAKTRFFGRFDPEVIEERKQSALKLLQFAANSSPLFTSQVFVKFFEEGHLVPECQQIICPPYKDYERILEPVKEPSYPTKSKLTCKYPEESSNLEENSKDCPTPLGGIWQHRQAADNISISSQCTDDDDRTTFTDDDSTVSRPSLNLAEFDPLAQSDGTDGQKRDILTQNNFCNSWLLSALQSCSDSAMDRDPGTHFEFPTPFGDFEVPDECSFTSKGSVSRTNSTDSKENVFTFDLPASLTSDPLDISDLDPLANKSTSSQEGNESCISDQFAMTPNAYKKEPTRCPAYFINASKHIESAQRAEESGQYKEAFDLYKEAIDVLMQGFQKDNCPDLKDVIRKKILFYLMRAEELYENKLPHTDPLHTSKINSIPVSPKLYTSLLGPLEELNNYKVLGILDKVLLVLDVTNSHTYIVKTLYKSASPSKSSAAHIVPQNVPFVVQLHRIYETSYALFLILEHASGGRLWDYVSSFLQRSPLSPCNDETVLYVESRTTLPTSNVYTGKKVLSSDFDSKSSSQNQIPFDLRPSERSPSSYVALLKTYADSMDEEGNVPLAMYHKLDTPSTRKRSLSSEVQSEVLHDINNKIHLQTPKNIRNRLSASTGSLEKTYAHKTFNFDTFNAMDAALQEAKYKTSLPESCISTWAAEIVLALEALHNLGIIWMDLHPNNILLGAEGHILLTHQSHWSHIDFTISEKARQRLFCAPEVGSIIPVTADCDWWSLGAILFELLTCQSLISCHPTGITQHTVLSFPTHVSSDAKDFITKLLQYNPLERLGSGIYGIEEIKSHPFFRTVDWKSLDQ